MKPSLSAAIAVFVAAFVVVGAAVHFALLWLSPAWATDHQIAEGLKRGARMNVLTYGKPPRAGTTSVPLANPDVLSTRAYLDLSKGPFVIEGLRPESCAYWSASVFAENTDAVLVSSDQQSPDRKISLALRMTSQTVNEPVLSQAVLPSKTAVVLLRCIMRDRVDSAYIAKLTREIHGLTMRPAREAQS